MPTLKSAVAPKCTHAFSLPEIFECAHLQFMVSGYDPSIHTRMRNAVQLVWGSPSHHTQVNPSMLHVSHDRRGCLDNNV